MKKLIVLSFVTLLCLPSSVYAASIGGAETQGQGRLAVGLDTAFVFEKDIKFKSLTVGSAATQEIKNVEMDEAYQVVLKTSYGLLDNLDAYIKLGMADYKIENDNYVLGSKWAEDKTNTDIDFAYGFGLKGTYKFADDWFFGCDLQYLRSKHEASLEQDYVTGIATGTYESLVIQEWHIAPYLATTIID